jgi:hypothetical protein
MANKKFIHGVCINTDLVRNLSDLKSANLFAHLSNAGQIEQEAAKELGFKGKPEKPKEDVGEGVE